MDIRVRNVPVVTKKHGCGVCLVTCCLVKWLGVLGKRKTHPDITGGQTTPCYIWLFPYQWGHHHSG